MTVVIDDPLVAGIAPMRTLPIHESAARLRGLYPECPRAYGVAVVADVGRRRWFPLADTVLNDRMASLYDGARAEMTSSRQAAMQVATSLVHTVVGRLAALVVLEARAWDPGLENLWVHVDSEGGIDWAGVVDPCLRVVGGDPAAGHDAVVTLPCEEALWRWTAHRSHNALSAMFAELMRVAPGTLSADLLWSLVGEAVVGAATYAPMLARESEVLGQKRGQGLLDAFEALGLPVRGRASQRACKVRAALPY